MAFGYKIINDSAVCMNCGAKVGKEKAKLNFCYKCGSPLNISSATKQEQQIAKSKILLLEEVLNEIEENKDARQVIYKFINELEEN